MSHTLEAVDECSTPEGIETVIRVRSVAVSPRGPASGQNARAHQWLGAQPHQLKDRRKVERPEIVAWDFAQYARLLAAAKVEGDEWYAAVCLAGEAGLRVGEVKALRWREDVDLIAKTLTVNFQTRNGETTTPKGRTRRTVPMTATLHEALKRMSVVWPTWRSAESAAGPACRSAAGTR